MQQESAKLGRYRLVERLAAGGMAEVYLARMQSDGGLEKTVVVKTILPEHSGNEEMRRMMMDEARIGFALRHQNIAQILDVGRQGDTLYVAIEHIDGMDLARLQRACERAEIDIDPLLVAYIGVEVLRALDYAHRRRNDAGQELHIIHRDISPHNVLLSIEGEVKLTDFGIARVRDRLSRTTTGGTKGKLAYMAPEQAQGGEIDVRADLFGVAATLYELLCGVPPFDGASDLEMLRAVERGTVRPLSERLPDLDPLLAGIVDSALRSDPNDRPSSAAQMRRPLEELLRGHAVSAEPLAELVRAACAAARELATQDAAFQRAILGAGTDTSSAALATASGTPTESTIAASPPADVVGKTPRRSWLPFALGAAVAVAAIAAVLATRGTDEARDSAEPSTATASAAAPPLDAATPLAAPPETERAPAEATEPKQPRKRHKPKAAATGTLTITSLPWTRVTIDGQYEGDTPLKNKRLRVGKHRVELSNPETGQRATRTISIKKGENTTLRLKL